MDCPLTVKQWWLQIQGGLVRPAASIIEQKGPQSVCLPLWLAGWLAVYQYYYCCCCHGPPQQSLAGLLKPAPGPLPAACLLYTINLCSLETVQGCREALRHNCPVCLPSSSKSKSGCGESEGGRNEWKRGWGNNPGGCERYRHLIVPSSMRLNSNHSHTIPMHLQT